MKQAGLSSILVAVALLAAGVIAEAQQAGKTPRIGIFVSASASDGAPRIKALQQGLREVGYVEGKNILIEYRYAEGTLETVSERIAELVRLNVDVLVVDTSNAINAAKKATKTIPIVFTTANDPVGDGQVDSLAKPGGNLTGFSILAL